MLEKNDLDGIASDERWHRACNLVNEEYFPGDLVFYPHTYMQEPSTRARVCMCCSEEFSYVGCYANGVSSISLTREVVVWSAERRVTDLWRVEGE